MHRFVLHNDAIRDSGELCLMPGQAGLLTGWGVFSTIRVVNGVLFAYERHFARMRKDSELLRVPFPAEPEWLESRLLRLVEANGAHNATLRVCVVRNKAGLFTGPVTRDFDVIAFTTELKDWGESVRLGIVPQARHAANPFAGTKVLSWVFNLNWYEEAHERGYDEVALLNERDEVSECTSANIFAVSGSEVWTPPLTSGCLAGVTREILLSEVRVPQYRISERTLRITDLEEADEVFITSTTRDLLPVAEIEGLRIRSGGRAYAALRDAFRAYMADYVSSRVTV